MNLKVPGAILSLGCAILSTRAITVRGGLVQPPLRRTRVNKHTFPIFIYNFININITKLTAIIF